MSNARERIESRIAKINSEFDYEIVYIKTSMNQCLESLKVNQAFQRDWEYSVMIDYNRTIADAYKTLGLLWHERQTLKEMLDILEDDE